KKHNNNPLNTSSNRLQEEANTTNNIPKYTDFKTYIKNIEDEIDELRNNIIGQASIFGFEEIPDISWVEQKDRELQDKSENLKKFNNLKNNEGELLTELEELRESYNFKFESKQKLEAAKEDFYKNWGEWLASNNLDPSLSPSGLINIYSLISTCYEKQSFIKQKDEEFEELSESIKQYEDKVEQLINDYGTAPEETIDFIIPHLKDKLDETKDNQKRLQTLNKELDKLNENIQTNKKQINEISEKIKQLFELADVENENDFREKAKLWNAQKSLEEDMQKSETNIKKISGDGALFQQYLEELSTTTLISLKSKKQELEDQINEINKSIEDISTQQGEISNQINQLTSNNSETEVQLQIEADTEKLNQLARKWASFALAEKLLGLAINHYEKERQPAVIQGAQNFFSNITNNGYERLYSPLNSAKILVEDGKGQYKDTEQLSRGTAEQLYLAIRFGFIRQFEKHNPSLPVIFDDVMVNFDHERSKNAFETLSNLANTNQILYFTCHPESVEKCREINPYAQLIKIGE
ncbi:MAG: ATP-binding protein, partial [Candidatus Woesearchaeota archaeon]